MEAVKITGGTHIASAEFAYTGGGLSATARGATEKEGEIRTLADDLDEADEHETVRDKVEHEQDRDRDNPDQHHRISSSSLTPKSKKSGAHMVSAPVLIVYHISVCTIRCVRPNVVLCERR